MLASIWKAWLVLASVSKLKLLKRQQTFWMASTGNSQTTNHSWLLLQGKLVYNSFHKCIGIQFIIPPGFLAATTSVVKLFKNLGPWKIKSWFLCKDPQKAPSKEENVKKIGRDCGHLRLRVYGNPLWSLLSSQLIFHRKSSQVYIQTSCCCCALYGGGFLTAQVMLLSLPAASTRLSKCLHRQHLSNELEPPYLDVRH